METRVVVFGSYKSISTTLVVAQDIHNTSTATANTIRTVAVVVVHCFVSTS